VRVLHGKATTRGFHPSATDALARWLDARRQLGGRGPLFCTLKGGPLSGQYVRNLRHTFAVELERADLQAITALEAVELPDLRA
jgi:hypothetical protein